MTPFVTTHGKTTPLPARRNRMGIPGPFELLIIAAILLLTIGLPIAVIALVIVLVGRFKS